MIVSPLRNLLTCTVVGFLFNVPIMSAIIIVYEKYTEGALTYAASMLPIIAQLSLVIFIIFMTMVTLGYDLMDKGCLAWHRESLGHLFQATIAYICILITVVNLMFYIKMCEEK